MTNIDELRRCAELTAAQPETEAEDVLAVGVLHMIAVVERVQSLRDTWALLALNLNDPANQELVPAVVADLTAALEARP